MAYIGAAFIPVFIAFTVGVALFRRLDVFTLFTEGARNGFSVVLKIAPSTIGLLTAVGMLSASGALDALASFLAPITAKVGFPSELVPLILLRPVSGSGAVAILESVLAKCGADSAAGRLASIICGGSETTFYAIAVYFGGAGIKKTLYTVPAAIIADITVIITATLMIHLGL